MGWMAWRRPSVELMERAANVFLDRKLPTKDWRIELRDTRRSHLLMALWRGFVNITAS